MEGRFGEIGRRVDLKGGKGSFHISNTPRLDLPGKETKQKLRERRKCVSTSVFPSVRLQGQRKTAFPQLKERRGAFLLQLPGDTEGERQGARFPEGRLRRSEAFNWRPAGQRGASIFIEQRMTRQDSKVFGVHETH
ncbi:hypothetical protein E2C01_064607 [Portunus trituberculatus]|uniref:Uncharacterized protein n=1 Tax=Portunus trituberculatus TaxID=210409 RepID=A0A5B7HGK9_PORTR|nr:hypothetical protein [Portunus trituberculatus]